jgi:hypothetical protein
MTGKMKVDKAPIVNGVPTASPNLCDAVMMAFADRVASLPPMGPILQMLIAATPR